MSCLNSKLKIVSFGLCAALLMFAAGRTIAQESPPVPAKTPVPQRTPSASDINRQRVLEQSKQQEQFGKLKAIGAAENVNRSLFPALRRDIETLYRSSTKKELKILAVDPADEKKFEVFLRQGKAGLFKLIDNPGCAEDINVVVATEDCLKYSMPGGGSSYSFRVKDYRIPHLADLTFADNILSVPGKLVHGILTGIGDVPLENVTLRNIGAKYVIDFQPVAEYEEALSLNRELSAGVSKDGFIYSRELNAVDNMTYILRSVAYDGNLYRAVNGVTYNELDFDKRRDITIAFRIVNREPGNSITILWKELENKNSPKIKKQPENKNQIKEKNFIAKSEGK